MLTRALMLALAACGSGAPGESAATSSQPPVVLPAVAVATDPYDITKMDFKSPPAVVSAERHTGGLNARVVSAC